MTKEKPSVMKKRSRPGSLGALFDVIDEAFPTYRTRLGQLDIRNLSIAIGISHQAMYRWFNNDRLPARNMKTLISLSKGRLSIEKLAPFSL